MEAEPLQHLPLPSAERVVIGGCAGLVGGFVAGPIAFDMEAGSICGVLLAPLLALALAACGAISRRRGWMAVQPLVWAVAGGVALHIDRLTGWAVGGAAGGLVNGLLRRSLRESSKGAVVGAGIGALGWVVTSGYLLAIFLGLEWLGAE